MTELFVVRGNAGLKIVPRRFVPFTRLAFLQRSAFYKASIVAALRLWEDDPTLTDGLRQRSLGLQVSGMKYGAVPATFGVA